MKNTDIITNNISPEATQIQPFRFYEPITRRILKSRTK